MIQQPPNPNSRFEKVMGCLIITCFFSILFYIIIFMSSGQMPGGFMFVLMGLFGVLVLITIIGKCCRASEAVNQGRYVDGEGSYQNQSDSNYGNGDANDSYNRFLGSDQNDQVAASYGQEGGISSNTDQ